MSGPIKDDAVAPLLVILAERTRASERTVTSFQPPHTGLVEEAGARRHQLVVGRRGVGKSMLLLNLMARAREENQLVVSLDMESYRDIPYPDVLIRVLAELAGQLVTQLRSEQAPIRGWRLRRSLSQLGRQLGDLLEQPAETRTTLVRESEKSANASAGVNTSIGTTDGSANTVNVSGSAGGGSQTTSRTTTAAEFTRTKMDGLQRATPEYRKLLVQAVNALKGRRAMIVLDDFYFIPRPSQPEVLAYLHQLAKGSEIWLKIGGVEHRLNPYAEGDPPRGMQPYHDAGWLKLDATLRDFVHTKDFLESILSDATAALDIQIEDLLTDAARERLVLASGGVPRDFLSLIAEALKSASRRAHSANRPRNKITVEDISDVASALLAQKEQELQKDASAEDVQRLRDRFSDIVRFCGHERKKNVFLVEATVLREEQWGRDIIALRELRFVHSIGNLTVKSSSERYTGRRFEAFVLDQSAYVITRARGIEIVPFWETEGFQRIRGAQLIYRPSEDGKCPPEDPADSVSGDWEQLEFEEIPEDQPQSYQQGAT